MKENVRAVVLSEFLFTKMHGTNMKISCSLVLSEV